MTRIDRIYDRINVLEYYLAKLGSEKKDVYLRDLKTKYRSLENAVLTNEKLTRQCVDKWLKRNTETPEG